jgi:hypothetical protein
MEELIMKVNRKDKFLRDFVNRIENLTAYETVNVSTNEVRKKCVKCGRIRIFYCKDVNFNYCDNCGRKILFPEDVVYCDTDSVKLNEYCDVENCIHFDAETFNCKKKHHCDCDCPDCSPESYI